MESETKYIDLTPVSMQTPEGAAKVEKAMTEWQGWQANVANLAADFFGNENHDDDPERGEEIADIRAALKRMAETQEAFLRALSGR